MNSVVSSTALLASCLSLAAGTATPCDYKLENSLAAGIANELDLLLTVPDSNLPAFDDQLRLMGFSGAPDTINDLSPPHQRVKFNTYLNSANGNNYFTGYEGGQFLGYYPDELLFRWRAAGAYDANVAQRTAYTFDPVTGDALTATATDVYDPRIRGWYQDAMAKCTSDLLGVYTCDLHWTSPFVFKSDGSLGITPALGFLDHTTGQPLGVSAFGFKLSVINTLLNEIVGANTDLVAYIMEGDGNLIAVSNNADVVLNDARVNAKSSTDPMISGTATLVIDDHYRSDQTVLVGNNLVTIKTFMKDDQLVWYIVIVEPYNIHNTGGDEDCIVQMETDMLEISNGEINLFLTNLVASGGLIDDAFRLGLIPSYVAPTAVDEAYGVQDYIWATIRNSDVARSIYVGYEDGTFVLYNVDAEYLCFRGADGSDVTRYYYYYDDSTGERSGGAYKTTTYDPRGRPWYTHAKQIGSGSFSPVFVFATSFTLGVTYSVPFYENGVLKGVIGVDFRLSSIDDILESQSQPGFGLFVFENEQTSSDDAYDMIASSSNVVVANSTRQHKAYDVMHTESYYVSTVAKHMYDNNLVHDADITTLPDVIAEVLNYDENTLHWRIVAYETLVTSVSVDASADSGDDDDELDVIVGLAASSLAIVVVILVLSILGIVLVKRSADSKPPMSGKGDSAL